MLTPTQGDARYVPRELLNQDYRHLDRADMFALGAVAYELARGRALSGNGSDYDCVRNVRGVSCKPCVITSCSSFASLFSICLNIVEC